MATSVKSYNVCVRTCLDILYTQRVLYIHAGGKLWEQIAWLPCCYKVIWHNRSWNVQAHHECIRCWERDQSVYKCIHAHIMCNRSWMEIDSLQGTSRPWRSSCHFPRHADIHFYDSAWLWLTLFWHWLVYQGGPVVRAQTQVQHDKQETRKRLPQDCQIGRIWKQISFHLNRYQLILPYTNLKTTPCDVVSHVRYSS